MIENFVNLINDCFDLSKTDNVFRCNKYRLKHENNANSFVDKKGEILYVKLLNIGEICDYIGVLPHDNKRKLVGCYLRSNGFRIRAYRVNGSIVKKIRLVLKPLEAVSY